MIEVHEHLADSAVLKSGVEATDYQKYLFLQLKSGQFLKLTSNFNYSLTKKRIIMISKNISKRKSLVRTILGLTLIGGIFVFYGFNNQRIIEPVEVNSKYDNSDSSENIPSILPLKEGGKYYIGSHYGWRKHPIKGTKHKHNGIDIVAERGTEIIAPADGTVIEAKYVGEYGNRIKLEHKNGYTTIFAHLQEFKVLSGNKVKKGDVIGFVGSTGMSTKPHLHYEVRKYPPGEKFIFLNPADYIKNIKAIPTKKKSS
jgi:murein DD-endopeptidase MepM/ murein hydrolase activator NlpD